MKAITIQPLSALIGAGVVLLASLAAGALGPASLSQPLAIDMLPRANSHVYILEGETYVVPPGKLLTVTTFGAADGLAPPGGGHTLKFNGQPVFLGKEDLELSLGITAASGVAVTVGDDDPFVTSVVLGYLSKG